MQSFFGEYIYQYDIAALILMIVILWMFLQFKNFPVETNIYFRHLLITSIFATVFDLCSVYVLCNEGISRTVAHIAQIAYYIPNMLCIVFYSLMALSMTKPYQKDQAWKKHVIYGIFLVDSALIVTSPFTGLMYSLDEDMNLQHGPLMPVRYIMAFVLILLIMIDFTTHLRLLTKVQKRVVYGYTVACGIGMLIMALDKHIMAISFSLSISLLLAYLSLQNPSELKDDLTNVGNLHAFNQTMVSYFRQHESFSLISIEYDSIDYYEKVLGLSAHDEILKELTERLAQVVQRGWIYYMGRKRFVLIFPHKSDLITPTAKRISDMSEKPIPVLGVDIKLTPGICVLHAPESISYVDDVSDAIEFAFSEYNSLHEKPLFFNVEEKAIIQKRREQAILRVLNRAITNDEFQVFFQPIFSPDSNRYVSAEALARLNDQTLGDIPPEEFIPIAERNGLIVRIGEIIVEHVCRFIEANQSEDIPLSGISINLSPVQCMQSDLAERIILIASKHNVPLNLLEFEVTAETISHARETFNATVRKLSDRGVRFTIDDYAVNMADAPLLTSLPLTTFKISRNVTNALSSSHRLLPAMRGSISSLKDLGYKVIATGIETKETAEHFRQFGVDELQGFFYSEPVSAREFANIIKEEQRK